MNIVIETGESESFWSHVMQQKEMPIIFGENATFFWRGDAKSVEWRGDFSSWDFAPESHGKRLGKIRTPFCMTNKSP
jgi:hypothetical protein